MKYASIDVNFSFTHFIGYCLNSRWNMPQRLFTNIKTACKNICKYLLALLYHPFGVVNVNSSFSIIISSLQDCLISALFYSVLLNWMSTSVFVDFLKILRTKMKTVAQNKSFSPVMNLMEFELINLDLNIDIFWSTINLVTYLRNPR